MLIQNRRSFLQKQLEKYNIVSTTNSNGDIIYVNDKFCEVTKYTREELIGKNKRILKSGIHPKSIFVDMWATLTSGKVWRGDVCNKAKDGTLYWEDSLIIPEMGSNGKPEYYHVFKIDITKRKKAEHELKVIQQQLALQLAEQKVINEILTISSATNNLSKFFKSCLNLLIKVPDLISIPHLGIYLFNDKAQQLELIVSTDFKSLITTKKTKELTSLLLKTKKAQYVNYKTPEYPQGHEHCFVPMLFNNTLLGVLEICISQDKNTAREIQFLETIATILANKTQMVYDSKKIKENELKYRKLYDTTPAMYFSISAQGEILEVNHFGAQSLGYTKEELEQKQVLILFPPHLHNTVNKQIKTCLDEPTKVHEWEIQKIVNNGNLIYVKEAAWVEYSKEGTPFLRIICDNITEQKQTKNALLAERNLLANGPLATFQWEATEGFPYKYISSNAHKIFGYTSKDFFSGKVKYTSIIHPNDSNRVKQEISYHIKSANLNYEQEYRVIHKNGTIKWVKAHVQITRNKAGIATLLSGHLYDTTQIHTAVEESYLLKERLLSLIEAIPDAIFFKDGKGRWLITNEAAKKLYKLNEIDWHGKTDTELGEMRSDYRQAHVECIKSDEEAWEAKKLTVSTEYIINKAGEERELEVRKMPLFNKDGSRKALVIVSSDVTESKRKEAEIATKNAKLEQVAWMFSHEVRAPVATIMGLANIFNFEDNTDPINADILTRIRQPIDSLHSTISYIVKETNELDK